jgi:hypothetical protein
VARKVEVFDKEKVMFATITKPLDYELPNRQWYQMFNGKWASHAWTAATYKEAMRTMIKRVTVRWG